MTESELSEFPWSTTLIVSLGTFVVGVAICLALLFIIR